MSDSADRKQGRSYTGNRDAARSSAQRPQGKSAPLKQAVISSLIFCFIQS
jgi:hypothetical protein